MSRFRKIVIETYIWAAEHLYHSLAWAYDSVACLVSFGYWSQWRRAGLAYLSQGNILEIGFGTGALLIEMTNRGYDVCGLEPSHEMQQVVSRKTKKRGIFVRRVRAEVQAIPFSGLTFSNILITFPSGYIMSEIVLGELKRVMKLDGRIVIVGMGVEFRSKIKRWLTGWFLESGSDSLIQQFTKMVKDLGFLVRLDEYLAEAYTLPVLILENCNEK